MKLLLSNCAHYTDDPVLVKLGIDWYRHTPQENKKVGFKKWKGFSIVVYLIKWQFTVTWVDDYKAYKYRMDFNYYDWKKKQ